MNTKVIAGNWKMNNLQADTTATLTQLIPLVADATATVIVCVPYTNLATALQVVKGTNVHVGAQNCHWAEKGAFTGEIAPSMLKEMGVEYVIVGHSERRTYFGETNQTVLARTKAALNAGLKPIVCIGETLEQRNGGTMEQVLTEQIQQGFAEITAEQMANVIVAYEPVWAIGTGVTATNEQANDAIAFCRSVFESMYGSDAAASLCIQYGGSMNDKNAKELLSMPHIDGGLVGGASLVAEKFATIVNAIK